MTSTVRNAVALLALCLTGTGCKGLLDLLETDEPNCAERTAYWPDTDADGVGDAGTVYLGCEAPDGYVDTPPDTALPVDTDAPDTDVPDTDLPPDSDVESDAVDSDAPDSD